MNFISNCIKGIAIGSGAILPGISSGVLCVIFGIYEDLLDHILNFFSDIKKHTKFLLPIFIGAGIGILIFSNILNYLLSQYSLQTKSIFIGLIFGSIPSLFKEVNQKCKFKLHYLLYTIVAFTCGIFLVILEKNIVINSTVDSITPLYLVLSGFAMSVGVVVPGVSSTIILMLFGIYSTYLSAISTLCFPILIPLGIGLILGCIVWMKLTKFFFEHFYAQTFYTIIGFSLGSIFVLMPSVSLDLNGIISLMCIWAGFLIANLLE